MKAAMALVSFLFVSTGAGAAQWQLDSRVDAMTDLRTENAFIENEDGDRLTILRRGGQNIWGFLSLGGSRMFGSSRQGVLLRVDDHPPVGFSEANTAYEWNPTLAGFRLGTDESSFCSIVRQLHAGEALTIRYFPSDSTQRDIRFELDPSSAGALLTATGVDMDKCTRVLDLQAAVEAWRASVMAKGLAQWKKPADLPPGTVLSFLAKVDPDGRVLNLRWVSNTGKRRIDRHFINAFNEIAPFDPPPAGFDASNGVLFRYEEGAQ